MQAIANWREQAGAEMSSARAALLEKFLARGLPSRKVEAWKFSDLARALSRPPALASAGNAPHDYFPNLEATRLCFSNGHALTVAPTMPNGVKLKLGAPAKPQAAEDGAILLAAACAQNGMMVDVAPQAKLTRQLYSLATAQGASAYLHQQWQLGEGAKAVLIESSSADDRAALHCLSDIHLAQNAQLFHLRLVAGEGVHVSSLRLHVEAGASYHGGVLLLEGGKLARVQSHIDLAGEGASAHLAAVLLGCKAHHGDFTTHIIHNAPACKSEVFARSVLDDKANGVFQARADIAAHAKGSEAVQESKAMLLASGAAMQAKPELRIETDDVQCAHGAASGAPDEAALFYLAARGFSPEAATALLADAFLSVALDKFPAIGRDDAAALAADWLAKRRGTAA